MGYVAAIDVVALVVAVWFHGLVDRSMVKAIHR